MDHDIHLSFRYTEQDYARAMRTHYRSRLRLRLTTTAAADGADAERWEEKPMLAKATAGER